GKDLREVGLLVGSGGVLRHGRPGVAGRVFAGRVGEVEGGWQLPRRAEVTVDTAYVLAAAGLLAEDHREAARSLVAGLVGRPDRSGSPPRVNVVSDDGGQTPRAPAQGSGERLTERLAHQLAHLRA